MIKKLFYETENFNGMIVTDGIRCVEILDFPQDGTLEMAKKFDISTIESLNDIEKIAFELNADICLLSDTMNELGIVLEEI